MCLNYIFASKVSSSESQGFLLRWLLIPMLRPKLINMRQMEKYLETECSDINYTVVRPPGLTNGTASGNSYIYSCKHSEAFLKVSLSLKGQEIKSENDSYFLKNSPSRMPRADVAKFMIDCLSKSELFKKCVAVGL